MVRRCYDRRDGGAGLYAPFATWTPRSRSDEYIRGSQSCFFDASRRDGASTRSCRSRRPETTLPGVHARAVLLHEDAGHDVFKGLVHLRELLRALVANSIDPGGDLRFVVDLVRVRTLATTSLSKGSTSSGWKAVSSSSATPRPSCSSRSPGQ